MFTRGVVFLTFLVCAMVVSCGDENRLSTTSENKADGVMNGIDKVAGSE